MKAEEFDKLFDDGEDISHLVDWKSGRRPGLEPKPVDALPPTDDWKPEHKPSDLELVQHAITSRLRRPLPVALALAMPNLFRAAVGITRVRRDPSRPSGGTPFNTPRTPWNAPLTPHRRVAFASISLDEVKSMKNAFGCTVNDIVLATATGALRRYLQRLDALPDRPLLAACPVSVRSDETADIESANKVSAMFVSLPTHLEDVEAQIAHIREATKGAKAEHHAMGARTLLELGELAGPRSFGLASRLLGGLATPVAAIIDIVRCSPDVSGNLQGSAHPPWIPPPAVAFACRLQIVIAPCDALETTRAALDHEETPTLRRREERLTRRMATRPKTGRAKARSTVKRRQLL